MDENKKKIYDIELNKFIDNINNTTNFSFTKVGDGEMMCIRGDNGANCDGQSYSKELGSELLEAYRYLAQNKDVSLAGQSDPRWRLIDVERKVFEGIKTCFNFVTYDILLNRLGEDTEKRLSFYKTIKNSKRKKIFLGNNRLIPVNKMLNTDGFIEIPSQNAFKEIGPILNNLKSIIEDNCIVLFSAGLISKVLMSKILDMNHNITCIDTGSAFDPLFIGQTRTEQCSIEELKELYKDLLV